MFKPKPRIVQEGNKIYEFTPGKFGSLIEKTSYKRKEWGPQLDYVPKTRAKVIMSKGKGY